MPSVPELEAQIEALRVENQALRQTADSQEDLLRAIADYAPVVLYAKDLGGRFTLSNRLHASLLEREPEEVLGMTEAALVGEAGAAEIQAVVDIVIASGTPHVAEFSLMVNGRRRVFLEHMFPLRSAEHVDGIGGAAIDITERKQAEDAVRVFVALAEYSPDGILVQPGDPHAATHANPALRRLLGIAADAPAEHAARRLGATTSGAREIFRDDGELVSVEVSTFEIPGATGERMASATVVRDVTHLTRALRERAQQVEINRQQQADLIAELSAPLLPLAPGVLLLPLIGSLDSARSLHVRDVVLNAVVQYRTRILIVDLTGLRAVDGSPADRLLQLIGAIQLVGAQVVLTGIRPAIAAAMIEYGFSSRPGLRIMSTLEDAVRTTLASLRMRP